MQTHRHTGQHKPDISCWGSIEIVTHHFESCNMYILASYDPPFKDGNSNGAKSVSTYYNRSRKSNISHKITF